MEFKIVIRVLALVKKKYIIFQIDGFSNLYIVLYEYD